MFTLSQITTIKNTYKLQKEYRRCSHGRPVYAVEDRYRQTCPCGNLY